MGRNSRLWRSKASVCVVVLGAHRSGTSAVAGCLHHLGVFMGKSFVGATKHNKRGHWEDVEFLALNKRIVGDWRRPLVVFQPHKTKYRELIRARKGRHLLWGFKDPRMCYVFPHFLTAVPDDVYVKVVDVNRSLPAQIKSMAARKGKAPINVSPERAKHVAQAYDDAKTLALRLFNGEVLTIQYENLVAEPTEQVGRLARFVELGSNHKAIEFIAPKLNHYK